MVELVAVIGILLLLLLATVELGRLSHVRLVMGAAAREGARLAAVDGGESGRVLEGISRQLTWGGVDDGMVQVELKPRWAAYGSSIRTTLNHTYTFASGLMKALFPQGVEISVTIYSRSERLEGR